MIDFGLSCKFVDPANNHIAFKEKTSLTGTARFASTNAHKGYELSRWDDLESISHMMLFVWLGMLPW